MKIIPAEKSTAAYFVSQQLQNLLGFGIHPDPEALSGAWLDAIKARIVETTDAAQRSFEGDAGACELLKSARRLAFQFAMLMHDRPKLSTIPVEEWNVESYRRLFDDLSAAERTVRTLSKQAQPVTEPAAAELDVPKSPKVKRGVCLRKIAEVCEPGDAVQQREAIARLRKSSASLPKVGYAARHSQTPLFDPKIAADFAHKNGLCDKPKDILPKLMEHLEDCRTD